MILRIVVQILFIGIMWGYIAYREEHKIGSTLESTLKPTPLWWWLILGLLFPLAFMWYMFLDALEKKK